jgi:hypothetical protein
MLIFIILASISLWLGMFTINGDMDHVFVLVGVILLCMARIEYLFYRKSCNDRRK